MRPIHILLSLLPLLLMLFLAPPAAAGDADGYVLHLEAEDLVGRAHATRGKVVVARSPSRSIGFSKDAWLHWHGARRHAHLFIPVTLAHSGRYRAALILGQGPWLGIVDAKVAGGPTKPRVNCFARLPGPKGRVELGTMLLQAGANRIHIIVRDKDPRSRAYDVIVDGIAFERLGPLPEAPKPIPTLPRPHPTPPVPKPGPPPGTVLERPGVGTEAFVPTPVRAQRIGRLTGVRIPRPRLEIDTDGRSLERHPPVWGTAMSQHFYPSAPQFLRSCRLRGAPGTATRVRWQVSAFEPDPFGRVSKRPPGLLGGGVKPLEGTGRARTFTLDLQLGRPFLGAGVLDLRPDLEAIHKTLRDRAARRSPSRRGARRKRIPAAPRPILATPAHPRLLYLRAIPLASNGLPIGPASNTVTIELRDPPALPDTGRVPTPGPAPAIKLVSFSPLRFTAADAHLHMVASRDVTQGELWPGTLGTPGAKDRVVWRKGTKFDYSKKHETSKEWYEYVGDAFGAVVDLVRWVTDAITWVAQQYDAIKAFAVDFAAGVLCPDEVKEACRSVVAGLLDSGLAALGLPPDLPTWDELVAIGEGELVDIIAEQAMQVAPAANIGIDILAEATAREMAKQLVSKARGHVEQLAEERSHRGGRVDWLAPDPDFQYRPAILKIQVRNPSPRAQEGFLRGRVGEESSTLMRSPLQPRRIRLAGGETRTYTLFMREVVTWVPETRWDTPAEKEDRAQRSRAFWTAFDRKDLSIRVEIHDWRVVGTSDSRSVSRVVGANHHTPAGP